MFTRARTHVHVHTLHVHACAFICACSHVRVHVCVFTCAFSHVHVSVCAFTCAQSRVHVGTMCHVEIRGQPWCHLVPPSTRLSSSLLVICYCASCTRLAGPQASKNSPVSASHLTVGELGSQACAPPCLALQVLGMQTKVFVLTPARQRALEPATAAWQHLEASTH